MSTSTLSKVSAPDIYPMGVECRVSERHPCGLQTSCQPVAARGDNDLNWPAEIRDLSTGGIGLVLGRRFERGTGLAIDIPETPSAPADTLLARVIHATAWDEGKWLIGCQFISPLSDDEVKRLLALGTSRPRPGSENDLVPANDSREGAETGYSFVVENVTLVEKGGQGKRTLRRLHLAGPWPLEKGAILRVSGKKSPNKVRLWVQRCYQRDGGWFIDFTFADALRSEERRAFGF